MRSTRARLLPLLIWIPLAVGLSGCAEGLLWRTGYLSPWARKKWAEEAEQYGPQLEMKTDDIRGLAAQAPQMSPDEQLRWSTELVEIVRSQTNPVLRVEAVKALGVFPTPSAAAGVRAALADKSPEVRVAACEALGRRGDAESLDLLAETVKRDAEVDVRLAAVRALARFDDPGSAPRATAALAVALDDRNPALQYRAIESLRSVSGKDCGNDLSAWRRYAAGDAPPEPNPTFAERIRGWLF